MTLERRNAVDVLLVDDDRDVRETIQQILEEEGIAVQTAVDGADALERLRKDPLPRLVLLDLMMPVMDGRQFVLYASRDPRLSGLPVVVISSGRDAQKDAAILGAAGYLAKPIELELLLTTVRSWLAH